jgi:hypothetical protein
MHMDVLAESSGPGAAQILFLLGLGLMIIILLVRSRRYFRQATQYQIPRPNAKSVRKPAPSSSAPPKDFEKWEVSMHELARDLSAQLDTKIRVLDLLIREANEAAARLEAARGPHSRGIHAALDAAPVEPLPRTATPSAPSRRSANPKASRESKQPLKIAGNPRFERVYALADAGMSPTTIANQIGSQVGEVELILSLRGTQPT